MPDLRVPPEQYLYARWLDWGTRLSLGALVIAFLIYAFGVFEPAVAVAELPRLWVLPVEDYLAATGTPQSWGWVRLLDRGDYLNLVGVALLGLVTVLCYLRTLPDFYAQGRVHGFIAIAQVVVLLAAASGLLAGGH